jgi:cytochrome c oxidase cbb3-type subunit 3/ubiquinol-cytochrome c reductase cytochrome c subunit
MKALLQLSMLLLCAIGLVGCRVVPGKPAPGSEAKRPDQVLDFPTLYQENCSACHGDKGKMGAAISLANPAYLSLAGAANLDRVTADGVPGTLMPPFLKKSGGMLTQQQIEVLTQGMIASWSKPGRQSPIPYLKTLEGDPANGAHTFVRACSRCHGVDGTGSSAPNASTGSLFDPSYLALISDQGLRSMIVAGQPDQGMPGSDQVGAHPLTDQDVTDIVAWLAAHRTPTPGQPYLQRKPQ